MTIENFKRAFNREIIQNPKESIREIYDQLREIADKKIFPHLFELETLLDDPKNLRLFSGLYGQLDSSDEIRQEIRNNFLELYQHSDQLKTAEVANFYKLNTGIQNLDFFKLKNEQNLSKEQKKAFKQLKQSLLNFFLEAVRTTQSPYINENIKTALLETLSDFVYRIKDAQTSEIPGYFELFFSDLIKKIEKKFPNDKS